MSNSDRAQTTPAKQSITEFETRAYNFSCPNCGEYFENEFPAKGKTIECACGETFVIGRTEYA